MFKRTKNKKRAAFYFLCLGLLFCLTGQATVRSEAAELGLPKQGDQDVLIRLRQMVFDPLQKPPAFPEGLTFSPQEALQNDTYLLQFTGPVQEIWKQAVEEAGGQFGSYIPDDAFIVRLNAQTKVRVEKLAFVRWVGAYEPGYKFDHHLLDITDVRSYILALAPWADLTALEAVLRAYDPHPRVKEGLAVAVLDVNQVQIAAHSGDVLWIEPVALMTLFNDIGGGQIMQAQAAWDSGLTGSGVMVAVADTGLDTGVAATIHQDFSGRVSDSHIASWPVQNINYGGGCIPVNINEDDGAADKSSGHGTHVAGSMMGDGERSGGKYKGLAYEATVAFQAIEQFTEWPSGCTGIYDGYYLTGIPIDPADLLEQAYNWGVRVQNISWGGGILAEYNSKAVSLDNFIYQHPDLVVVVAAGNAGKDSNADGYVDQGSILPPSTAKNVISIGAVDNERLDFTIRWYSFGFTVDPTKNDLVSDSRQEMAAFSGRGPTQDGRIKPDLVAPGTYILSTKSSQASGSGWGIFDNYYMYNGGTSMASPLSAGSAALVRQYYMDVEGHVSPSAALIKATLINSAVDISGYGVAGEEAGQPIPNNHEGWGLINVAAATTKGSRRYTDHSTGVGTGETYTAYYSVSTGKPFKVTLVWSDPAGSAGSGTNLVNNLDLRVTAPDGSTQYWGNVFSGGWSQTSGVADVLNNVENVYIQSPAAGWWQVDVVGQIVPQGGKQPFVLVVDGNLFLAPPQIKDLTPRRAPNDGPLVARIEALNLTPDTSAALLHEADTITGTSLIIDPPANVMTATFNLAGAVTGYWDLKVQNPAGSDVEAIIFLVLDASLPDLSITKQAANSHVEPGGTITYTIQISNTSNIAASGVVFTDTLPSGVSYASLQPDCLVDVQQQGNDLICHLDPGTLAGSSTVFYQLVVTVNAGVEGILENRVQVAGLEQDRFPADNKDRVSVLSGKMTIYLPLVFNR